MADHSGFKALGEIDLNQKVVKNRGGICIVDRAAAITIPSGVGTIINFDREIYDPQNMHSLTNNPSRITIPEAGLYKVQAHGRFLDQPAGDVGLHFLKNGMAFYPTGTASVAAWTPAATGGRKTMTFFYVLPLTNGDYLELVAYQFSGGNLTLGYVIFYVERI